jgi:hypothetical protein
LNQLLMIKLLNIKNSTKIQNFMHFDSETNIMCWEIAKDPIDHAIELGNFIIHLSKAKKPVLIEILNASKFVGQMDKVKLEGIKKQMMETN